MAQGAVLLAPDHRRRLDVRRGGAYRFEGLKEKDYVFGDCPFGALEGLGVEGVGLVPPFLIIPSRITTALLLILVGVFGFFDIFPVSLSFYWRSFNEFSKLYFWKFHN